MTNFIATITDIAQRTPSVKSFRLEHNRGDYHFSPGQWVDLHLTIDDESHNGGYSIISTPQQDTFIEVAIKRTEQFPITRHFHDNIKIGDTVFISAGKGEVYLPAELPSHLVLIAGGVGVTPFLSMIRHIYEHAPHTHVTLVYSITQPEEFLFREELRMLEKQHPSFRCVVTVTRTPHNKEQFSGRINAEILKSCLPNHGVDIYLCGPPNMVDDITALLTSLGVTSEKLHFDKWW